MCSKRGQQDKDKDKDHDGILCVVEAAALPQVVVAARAVEEEAAVGAVEAVDAVEHVLGRVRVHEVEVDGDALPVRLVDERLELLGRAVAARRREERRHLVAEAGVVRVLHDGHELDGVVALLLDVRQHVLAEVVVRGDLALGRADAHVAFVDARSTRALRSLILELVHLQRNNNNNNNNK